MPKKWDDVRQRLATKAADGQFLAAYTGTETDAELGELIILLAEHCKEAQAAKGCVIHALKKIPIYTLKNIVKDLRRKTCLEMLDEECACRNRPEDGNRLNLNPPPFKQTPRPQTPARFNPQGLPDAKPTPWSQPMAPNQEPHHQPAFH